MRLHLVLLAALIGLAASEDDECLHICTNNSQEERSHCLHISVEKCWVPLSKCDMDVLNCTAKTEIAAEKAEIELCAGKTNICVP